MSILVHVPKAASLSRPLGEARSMASQVLIWAFDSSTGCASLAGVPTGQDRGAQWQAMEPLGGKEAPSLTKALNRDALEEVFLHCSPEDLLALRATCSAAADLLDSNEKVWLSKLRESFGLNLKVCAGVECMCEGARRIARLTGLALGPGGAAGRTVERRAFLLNVSPERVGTRHSQELDTARPAFLAPRHHHQMRCHPLAQALAADSDALFVRLARRVFEASRAQQLRFQGVFVNGGVDEVGGADASAQQCVR